MYLHRIHKLLVPSTFLLLLGLWAISACNPISCLQPLGDQSTSERTLLPFHTLRAIDGVEIVLRNDNDPTIHISGAQNLHNRLEAEVQNGILTLSDNSSCRPLRPGQGSRLRVSVGAKDLVRIEQLGFAPILTQDSVLFSQPRVEVYCEGTGDLDWHFVAQTINLRAKSVSRITWQGRVEELEIFVNHGLGKIFAQSLIAQHCNILHDYYNEVHLYPIRSLSATILESGTVYYHHRPQALQTDIRRSGRVIPAPGV